MFFKMKTGKFKYMPPPPTYLENTYSLINNKFMLSNKYYDNIGEIIAIDSL